MKKIFFIFAAIAFSLSVYAQNTDTLSNPLQSETFHVPSKTAARFILNFGRMLFWPNYSNEFIIAVSNNKEKLNFEAFFANRLIHGRPVKIILVNKISPQTLPNIIYISTKEKNIIPTLQTTYSGQPVLIISETPTQFAYSDIAFQKKGPSMYSYRYNFMSINNKHIIITPEFLGYSDLLSNM